MADPQQNDNNRQLREDLEFTHDDLEANRAGRLSTRQQEAELARQEARKQTIEQLEEPKNRRGMTCLLQLGIMFLGLVILTIVALAGFVDFLIDLVGDGAYTIIFIVGIFFLQFAVRLPGSWRQKRLKEADAARAALEPKVGKPEVERAAGLVEIKTKEYRDQERHFAHVGELKILLPDQIYPSYPFYEDRRYTIYYANYNKDGVPLKFLSAEVA